MLKIRKSSTNKVVAEEDHANGGRCGCGCNCPQAARSPPSAIGMRSHDARNKPHASFLESLLRIEWEDRMHQGMFRYDIAACKSKVLPGKYGFIAQLNQGRHLQKRPSEFHVDQVLQPFDRNKFNFTKIRQQEILLQLGERKDGGDLADFPSVVAINVSPIEYGHVLLIPHISECLPQRMDRGSFMLALAFAIEVDNPYFRVGYNSLGAFATVNHLHFQAYFLAISLPVEKSPMKEIGTSDGGVKICQLVNYPVRGFAMEGGKALGNLSDAVADACICLQESNIPHNVLVSNRGRRVFLFPQCYAEKQALGEVSSDLVETHVNPAVWEIGGHVVLKKKTDYDEASEETALRLLSQVSLPKERFRKVTALVLKTIAHVRDFATEF